MTPQKTEGLQVGLRLEGLRIALLGGSEHVEDSPNATAPQAARVCEAEAREHARRALALPGALAFQGAALSRHYAGRALALMIGCAQ